MARDLREVAQEVQGKIMELATELDMGGEQSLAFADEINTLRELGEQLERALEGTEEPEPEPGYYAYDPLEDRSWGPFEDEHEVSAFMSSDKYLESWAVVRSQPAEDNYGPGVYHGDWPKPGMVVCCTFCAEELERATINTHGYTGWASAVSSEVNCDSAPDAAHRPDWISAS